MEQTSLSRVLARFIVGFSFTDLPPHIVELTKIRILDLLGACFAGQDLPWSKIAVQFARNSKGGSTVVGYPIKASSMDAALANAVLSHSILTEDYVEVAGRSAGHPGIVVVPVALAMAEEKGLPGTDVITAIVLGYDVLCRVGLGLADKMRPGFRAVPVLGPFGAVAAAGKLLSLNENELVNALGYAANFASGMSETWEYGSMEAVFQAGVPARNGILAAVLASMGATAAETALEGRHGFYMAFSGSTGDISAVTADFGTKFLISEAIMKLYPACTNHQIPINLVLTLKEQNGIKVEQIDRIVSTVSPKIKFSAGDDFAGPFTNQFQAQMSQKFCLAAALLGKSVTSPTLYIQHYNDYEILSLAQKVELVAEASRGRFEPKIDVFMKDGKHYASEENRLSKLIPDRNKIEERFLTYASNFLGKEKAANIVDTIMNLDKLDNVNELTSNLA